MLWINMALLHRITTNTLGLKYHYTADNYKTFVILRLASTASEVVIYILLCVFQKPEMTQKMEVCFFM